MFKKVEREDELSFIQSSQTPTPRKFDEETPTPLEVDEEIVQRISITTGVTNQIRSWRRGWLEVVTPPLVRSWILLLRRFQMKEFGCVSQVAEPGGESTGKR